MGRSTSQELITRGKAENAYNNSGISADVQWVDFFNDALADLVDDLAIQAALIPINLISPTREYDLPTDFFGIESMYDGNGNRIAERRTYEQKYPVGYRILNKGSKFVVDLYNFTTNQTFTGQYIRYPVKLTSGGASSEYPEVPTMGEKALFYYAIAKALRNNNQPGQAAEYDKHYEVERKKIRTAMARSRGG